MTIFYHGLLDGTKCCTIAEWAVYFGTPIIGTHTYIHTTRVFVRQKNLKSLNDMKG
jgi:hypothetical protein